MHFKYRFVLVYNLKCNDTFHWFPTVYTQLTECVLIQLINQYMFCCRPAASIKLLSCRSLFVEFNRNWKNTLMSDNWRTCVRALTTWVLYTSPHSLGNPAGEVTLLRSGGKPHCDSEKDWEHLRCTTMYNMDLETPKTSAVTDYEDETQGADLYGHCKTLRN